MEYEIKKYELEIVGTSPVIWNVMKKEIEDEKKKLKKNELSDWEENNWIKKAEFDKKGNPIIPERWLKGVIEESCKKTRMIPHYATRKNETYTYYVGSFMIYNQENNITKKDVECYGAFVGAQGKNSSTKVWRNRPLINKWSNKITIIDPAGRMKLDELKSLIEYGGLFLGIGDNRKNNFGRFEIRKLIEVK